MPLVMTPISKSVWTIRSLRGSVNGRSTRPIGSLLASELCELANLRLHLSDVCVLGRVRRRLRRVLPEPPGIVLGPRVERLRAHLEAPGAFAVPEPPPHHGCDVVSPPVGQAVGHSVKVTQRVIGRQRRTVSHSRLLLPRKRPSHSGTRPASLAGAWALRRSRGREEIAPGRDDPDDLGRWIMVGHRASAFTRPLVALLSLLAACPDHPRPMWWKFRATLSNNGRAFSDGATGALRWSVQVPPQGLIGCPILWSPAAYNSWTDARVLVGDGAGVLSGILPLQGNIEWQFHTGDAITGCADAPLNQSAVYVANASGAVFALPASKPQQAIWKHPLVPGSSVLPTSPAVSGDYVYIGGGSVLYALRTTNGSEAWHYPMPAQIVVVSAPLVTEDVNGEGIVV